MGFSVSKAIGNVLTRWLMKNDDILGAPMCDFDRIKYELRPCDILLIEGRNRVSEVIKMVTQSPWSHAAIYIGRLHDIENPILRRHVEENYFGDPSCQLVIESYLGQGTIVSSIDVYQEDHIRICRPSGISRQDAQHVISYAISRLGVDYDVRQIFDLLRYLLPWGIMPRRWRSSLFRANAGRATKQICSTLLAEAFSTVNFPILPVVRKTEDNQVEFVKRNPRLCTPSDFDYSPYFKIIKYPLYEVKGYTNYRDLPWNRDGAISDNHGKLLIPKHSPYRPKSLKQPTTSNKEPKAKK